MDVVRYLLEHKASAHVHAKSNRLTPLHLAAQMHYVDVARLLLDHGAQVNATAFQHECTALHMAIWGGDRDDAAPGKKGAMVELLLSRGADEYIKDKSGITPLQMAAQFLDLSDFLPRKKAKVEE